MKTLSLSITSATGLVNFTFILCVLLSTFTTQKVVAQEYPQPPQTGGNNDYLRDRDQPVLPGKMAVYFNRNLIQNDNRGQFWTPGVTYNQKFFFSGNFYPIGTAEYVVSAGHGGLHPLLVGFSGCDPTTNKTQVTGNVGSYPQNSVAVKNWQNRIPELMVSPKYAIVRKLTEQKSSYEEVPVSSSSSVSSTSFVSSDKINCNEWVNISVGYDGIGLIGVWVNGIPSAQFPFDGKRMALYPFETTFFVGGSDHSMYNGWIRNLIFFEGAFPLDNVRRSFTPERNFQSVVLGYDGNRYKSSILVNYADGNLIDYSSGFEGVMHTGKLARNPQGNSDVGLFGFKKTEEDILDRMAVFPYSYPSIVPVPDPSPSGSIIFDSFARPNSHPADESYVGLGQTETGSKQWLNSRFVRVIDGQLASLEDYQTAYFDTGSNTGKVCARRGNNVSPNSAYYELNFKTENNANKISLVSDPYGAARFMKYENSQYSSSVLATGNRPDNWFVACVEYSETSMKAFFDGQLVLESTVPKSFAGYSHVGLTLVSSPSVGTRWDWISVQ